MKKLIPIAIAVVLICVIGLVWVWPELKEKVLYSTDRADLNEYFEIYSENEAPVFLEDELTKEKLTVQKDTVYADLYFVNKNITNRFYYNETELTLQYTTATDIYTVYIGDDSTSYYKNEEAKPVDYKIAYMENDVLYIALPYIKYFCDFSYELFRNPYRVQIYTEDTTINVATVKRDTAVRVLGGTKCDILTEVSENDTVTILNKMEKWAEVKTTNGFIGYMEVHNLEDFRDEKREIEKTAVNSTYPDLRRNETVTLGWQYVGTLAANDQRKELTKNATGLNTVSPTWFFLNNNEGGFVDLSSSDYVKKAHTDGLQVWGLVDDFTYDVDLVQLLSSSTNRKTLISKLIDSALACGMDGINIDFEGVTSQSAPHFLQFLRELSIQTHANGIILSVDNYMPNAGNLFYDYKEQSIIIDYLILMGYDEHWAGCSEAGSVASLTFIKEGIQKVIDLGVPAGKIINAIPFYTRVWEITGGSVSDTTYSMVNAAEWIKNNNVELTWDDESCQYYGEKERSASTLKIWMEETESIGAKLSVMRNFHLSGAAFWRLGYENQEVWNTIGSYLMLNTFE